MNSVESTFCGRRGFFFLLFGSSTLSRVSMRVFDFVCGGEKITLPQVMRVSTFLFTFLYLLCMEREEGYLNTRDAFHSPSCLETLELIPVVDLNIFVCDGVGEIRRKELNQKFSARCPDIFLFCTQFVCCSIAESGRVLNLHLGGKKRRSPFDRSVASSRSFDHEKLVRSFLLVLLERRAGKRVLIPATLLLRLYILFCYFSYARKPDSSFFHHHHQLAGSLISFVSSQCVLSPLPVTVPRSKKSFVANKKNKWT